ncbi:MAG: hypothetical protein AAGB13_03990 [Cyanobacteria bacterium P01_F01_bin.33]
MSLPTNPSRSVCAVFARQFSLAEWKHLQSPASAARFIRAVDRHLHDRIGNLASQSGCSAVPSWQYQLWPRELTVAIAADTVPQLSALEGFDAFELRQNLSRVIETLLQEHEFPETPSRAIPASAVS